MQHGKALATGQAVHQHAVAGVAVGKRLQPVGQAFGQLKLFAFAVLAQGLHQHLCVIVDVEVVVLGGVLQRLQIRSIRMAHQRGYLPQHIVLQFVHFLKGLPKRIGARHHGHPHDEG